MVHIGRNIIILALVHMILVEHQTAAGFLSWLWRLFGVDDNDNGEPGEDDSLDATSTTASTNFTAINMTQDLLIDQNRTWDPFFREVILNCTSCQYSNETCILNISAADVNIGQDTLAYYSNSTASVCAQAYACVECQHSDMPTRVVRKCEQLSNVSISCDPPHTRFPANHTRDFEMLTTVGPLSLTCEGNFSISDCGRPLSSVDEHPALMNLTRVKIKEDNLDEAVSIIKIAVPCVLALIIVVVAVGCIIWRRRKRIRSKSASRPDAVEYSNANIGDGNLPGSEAVVKIHTSVPRADVVEYSVPDQSGQARNTENPNQNSYPNTSQNISSNEDRGFYSRLHEKARNVSETYGKLGPEETGAGNVSVEPSGDKHKPLVDDPNRNPIKDSKEPTYNNEQGLQTQPAGLYSRLGEHERRNMKHAYDVWPSENLDTSSKPLHLGASTNC